MSYEIICVRFLRATPAHGTVYNAGDRAGFPAPFARKLIAMRAAVEEARAEPAKSLDVTKPAQRAVTKG